MRLDTIAAIMMVSFIGYYCGGMVETLTTYQRGGSTPAAVIEASRLTPSKAGVDPARGHLTSELLAASESLEATLRAVPLEAAGPASSRSRVGASAPVEGAELKPTRRPGQAFQRSRAEAPSAGVEAPALALAAPAGGGAGGKEVEAVGSVLELESLLKSVTAQAGKPFEGARSALNSTELEAMRDTVSSILSHPPPPPPPPPRAQAMSTGGGPRAGSLAPGSSSSGGGGGFFSGPAWAAANRSSLPRVGSSSGGGGFWGELEEEGGRATKNKPKRKGGRGKGKGKGKGKETSEDEVLTPNGSRIPWEHVDDAVPPPPPSASTLEAPEASGGREKSTGAPNWKLKIPHNLGKGVYALHDVCIEAHPRPWLETKAGSCPHRPDKKYNINRRIVVYNSKQAKAEQNWAVGGHGNRKNLWEIFYAKGPPPSTHAWADYPALFVTTSCEANLHHFLVDQFSRIYTVMKAVGRLGLGSREEYEADKVALLYRDHVHDFCRDTGCHDPTKFEDLLFTLPVRSHMAYFADDSHLNVCFKDAVIGTHREGVKDAEVSQFILQGLANRAAWAKSGGADAGNWGSYGQCESDPAKTVLILQRRNRRLLNAEDLATYARSKGLAARVVEFDGMSVRDQISTVRCCRLFVAVMGAGQQWVSFMKKGSTLLSIGWKNWNANYYEKYAKESGVSFVSVLTAHVRPNWADATVVKHFGADKLKSASYRNELEKKAHKQVAKASDVTLNAKELAAVLTKTFGV